MDKLSKLNNAIFIIFMLSLLYIFYYYYHKKEPTEIDLDGDGVITASEIKTFIKKEMERNQIKPPKFKTLIKSSLSGAIRGALMGLLLNGLEGALTSALVLGMINPIITSLEHNF